MAAIFPLNTCIIDKNFCVIKAPPNSSSHQFTHSSSHRSTRSLSSYRNDTDNLSLHVIAQQEALPPVHLQHTPLVMRLLSPSHYTPLQCKHKG